MSIPNQSPVLSADTAGEVAGKLIPPNAADLNDPFFQRSPPKRPRHRDAKVEKKKKREEEKRKERETKRPATGGRKGGGRGRGEGEGRDEQMTRTRNEKCGGPPAVGRGRAGVAEFASECGGSRAGRMRSRCVNYDRNGNNDRGSVQTLRSLPLGLSSSGGNNGESKERNVRNTQQRERSLKFAEIAITGGRCCASAHSTPKRADSDFEMEPMESPECWGNNSRRSSDPQGHQGRGGGEAVGRPEGREGGRDRFASFGVGNRRIRSRSRSLATRTPASARASARSEDSRRQREGDAKCRAARRFRARPMCSR